MTLEHSITAFKIVRNRYFKIRNMDSNDTNEFQDVQIEPAQAVDNDVHAPQVTEENGRETSLGKKRIPRRVLHFSDGVLEEYSTDEDEGDGERVKKKTVSEVTAVDPKSLTWGPWLMYKAAIASSKTLSACDFAGEKLAGFFGITTPKYEYEIDVYEAMKCEDEERRKQEDVEMGGWAQSENNTVHVNGIRQE